MHHITPSEVWIGDIDMSEPEHISTILERVVEKLVEKEETQSGINVNKISCCFGCEPPKRYPGCHDKCEEYQKQKAEWEEMRRKYRAIRDKEIDLTDYDVQRHERVLKYYRKNR